MFTGRVVREGREKGELVLLGWGEKNKRTVGFAESPEMGDCECM